MVLLYKSHPQPDILMNDATVIAAVVASAVYLSILDLHSETVPMILIQASFFACHCFQLN